MPAIQTTWPSRGYISWSYITIQQKGIIASAAIASTRVVRADGLRSTNTAATRKTGLIHPLSNTLR